MSGRSKNRSEFLLNFMRSYQDLAFSTRIQDGSPRNNQRDKKDNVWQAEKPERVVVEFYEVPSGLHFFHQDPGWEPNGKPTGQKRKCLTGRRTLASFCWILWGPIRTSLFPPGSRMGAQWTTKGKGYKMFDRPKNLSEFLLSFMRSYQDLTFSTRIQDGSPRDNQGNKKRKCLTGRTTLASFCSILWGPIRTSLFPPGSRMGAQGTTKGKKRRNVWQAEQP